MLYAVGTYIDLRYLNDKAVVEEQSEKPQQRQPAFYPVGTKILFLNLKSSLEILNVKTQTA